MDNGKVLKAVEGLMEGGATTGQVLSALAIALREESRKERAEDAAQADRLMNDAKRVEELLVKGVEY